MPASYPSHMKAALVLALALAAAAAADAAPPRLCYLIYVHNNATLEGAADALQTLHGALAARRSPPPRAHGPAPWAARRAIRY